MKNVIVMLKNTQGIFSTAMDSKNTLSDNSIAYVPINRDKINMSHDMHLFLSDFRKATSEAKLKH